MSAVNLAVNVRRALLSLFVLAVLVSSIICVVKLDSLSFHTRDFPYYAQFYSKLFDDGNVKQYSLNPDGYNFLGLIGTEGTNGFNKALHLEPIKYVLAALYALTGSLVAVFVFIAMLVFSPLIYLAAKYKVESREDGLFLLLISLLLVVFPSAVLTVGYDYRPYVFLTPLFALSILSVYLRQSSWESALFLSALFCAREEALLLGAVVILYATSLYDGTSREKRRLVLLSVTWLAWALLSLIYFVWSGYPLKSSFIMANWTSIGFLLFIALLIPVYLNYAKAHPFGLTKERLSLVSYSLVFIPLGFGFASKHKELFIESFQMNILPAISDVFFSPRYYLLLMSVVLVLIVSWNLIGKKTRRHQVLVSLFVLSAASLLLNISNVRGNILDASRLEASEIVFDLRAATDKYSHNVLTDYEAYQAFFDYKHVYVYERLPWYLVEGIERFYPSSESSEALMSLLNGSIDYVVVSKVKVDDIHALFATASVNKPSLWAENDEFVVFKLK
jgi:hypothetical protein